MTRESDGFCTDQRNIVARAATFAAAEKEGKMSDGRWANKSLNSGPLSVCFGRLVALDCSWFGP
jgi:hypothetical protein